MDEQTKRPSRRKDRVALRDALDEALDERRQRLREVLYQRSESTPDDHDAVLVVGLGCIDVALGDDGRVVTVPDAPVTSVVERGVRVLGPPLLAELVATAYAGQLDDRYGPGRRWPIETGRSAADAPRPSCETEIWLGPDGSVCARSPFEARGQWIPIELRL